MTIITGTGQRQYGKWWKWCNNISLGNTRYV